MRRSVRTPACSLLSFSLLCWACSSTTTGTVAPRAILPEHARPETRLTLAPATTTAQAIREAAERVRSYSPRDQFDSGPDLSALVGQTFDVYVDARERGIANEICPGSPDWGWYGDRSYLEFSYGDRVDPADYWTPRTSTVMVMARSEQGTFHHAKIYSFHCVVSRGRPYSASNAFGASTMVTVRNEIFTAFAFSSHEEAQLRALRNAAPELSGPVDFKAPAGTLAGPRQVVSGGDTVGIADPTSFGTTPDLLDDSWGSYNWGEQLPPDRARALSKSLRFRIRGRIGEWSEDKPIVCGIGTETPTISEPIEANVQGCFVNALVQRVELVDRVNGAVLRSWTPLHAEGR